jgi:multidrug efflux pump subunit AcrA (membrane-fusion protein)
MNQRTRASWLVYALGALCAGAIAAAILVVGPASGSQTAATRTATVAQGVVQSTVSGSGNLQPASQLDLGFKTSGTVTNIYVTQGQQVTEGQLIAALDPQSAEVTLEQAKAALESAEASLAKEEETDGEGSSGGSSGATGSAASVSDTAATAAYSPPAATTTTPATTPTSSTPVSSPPTQTTPTTTSTTPTGPTSTTTTPTTTTQTTPTTTTTTTTPSRSTSTHEAKETTSKQGSGSSTTTTPTISTATREANLASARAAVKSDKLTVQSDQQAVASTKLYAPEEGTIASLTGQVGETVSGAGTTRASSSSSSSSTSSGAGGATSATAARSSTAASTSSSTGSSSSSSFAVLSNLSSMQLVVPLSESEIGSVKVGQIATVTIEALNGRKVAAHVKEVAILSTSDSGVVSYDVTFELDQLEAGIKPGMSASAEVVVKQAEGVNVPTTAISADTVTVLRAGKDVRQRVVTGLAGNSSTIILSGLKVGETIVLPSTSTSSSSLSSLTSRRSGLGGAAGGLGGGGLAGGGGAAFFRGGG